MPCEDSSGLWGYCSADGVLVLDPAFVVATDFLDTGMAAVATRDEWLYIDVRGRIVIRPLVFDNGPDRFQAGLARFVADGKVGFFDRTGIVVIEPRFEWARPFCEGLAAVCLGCRRELDGEHLVVVGGRWGFIDAQGEVVIAPAYDEVEDVHDGWARCLVSEEWARIPVPAGSRIRD